MLKKILLALWPFSLLLGCQSSPFALEPPDYRNVVHVESGLYVHREMELRVNAARLEMPPVDAAEGATSVLKASRFFPGGTASADFIPTKFERRGEDLVWTEATHLSKDDLDGKTSRGAEIRWEKEGKVTVTDGLEIFALPIPDISQLDTWGPWVEADSRREGIFAWHAEVREQETEVVPPPAHPFQMRFRLVLSQRMYP